jgi:hypothetical protein
METESRMNTPADRTVKRLSREEWYARYDAIELLRPMQPQDRRARLTGPAADRVAVRT